VKTIQIALGLLILGVPGFFIPQRMDNGAAKFRYDPTLYRVAVNALEVYATLNRDPIARIVAPGARVVRVWEEPGHCHDPRATGESADYRAEVQGLSWFGIAGPIVDVTCGGMNWKRRPSRFWKFG
jgi:hypothetical protein